MQNDCQTSAAKPLQLKTQDNSLAVIDANNIWKDDALGRERESCNLETLIAGQDGPLTLCLDGPWGTGKHFSSGGSRFNGNLTAGRLFILTLGRMTILMIRLSL